MCITIKWYMLKLMYVVALYGLYASNCVYFICPFWTGVFFALIWTAANIRRNRMREACRKADPSKENTHTQIHSLSTEHFGNRQSQQLRLQ